MNKFQHVFVKLFSSIFNKKITVITLIRAQNKDNSNTKQVNFKIKLTKKIKLFKIASKL